MGAEADPVEVIAYLRSEAGERWSRARIRRAREKVVRLWGDGPEHRVTEFLYVRGRATVYVPGLFTVEEPPSE